MRNIVCMLLALVMMLSVGCAFAEQSPENAVPSVTMGTVLKPDGTTYGDDFTVALETAKEESKEAEIFKAMQETDVVTYFGAEKLQIAAAFLPEGQDLSKLVVEEAFVLDMEGYQAEYGDVLVTFEMYVEYTGDEVVVAMVGIVDAETQELSWFPAAAATEDGKVKIAFTQEIMTMMLENEAVLALLRAY